MNQFQKQQGSKKSITQGCMPVFCDDVKPFAQHIERIVITVRHTIGAVASFKIVHIVDRLPKTRSGKILRKIIRAIVDNVPYQVPSTIEDITVLDEIKWKINQQ